MGNEVANPFGGGLALKDRQAMARRVQESASAGARGGAPDGSVYLNFSGKRGMYKCGDRQIQNDELWVLNIASFEDGWKCWKGGQPKASRMANIFTGTPVATPADDEGGPFDTGNGEGWHRCKAWVSKNLDTDEQGYFSSSSVSGVGEMASMLEEVSRRMASGQPCWPLFHYDMEEFTSQGHKNFKPAFKIYGWLDDENVGKLVEDDVDVDELIAASDVAAMVPDNAKKDTEEKAADPAPEPQKTRRRRRSS